MVHRIEETVARDICIGCGVCGAATQGAIPIRLSTHGLYKADLSGVNNENLRVGSRVCPFSDESPNEDFLGAPHESDSTIRDSKLGPFMSTFAGRVNDDQYLKGSSSGGLTSWVVDQLIRQGHADAVIKVGRPGPSESELFGYSSADKDKALDSRKSHYYASTLSDALSQIRNDDRRFILLGVPCFIRAARALCKEQPEYSKKLVFFIGLVCGHYKTQSFAESLAWQMGVHPNDLEDVDFRVKNFDRPSSDYDFGAKSRTSDEWSFARTGSLVGGNWGYNAFQPEACNFCDDVVGETADASFGDAWLPQYTADSRGTNVVISRSELIDQVLLGGLNQGDIHLEALTADDAIKSQAGGFRHRREGLAVRLADDISQGLSVPKKRVEPDSKIVPLNRRLLIRQRRHMAKRSQVLFEDALRRNDLSVFLEGMNREISRYRKIDAMNLKKLPARLKVRLMRLVARR